jgi:YVTN family beta-propeller protein
VATGDVTDTITVGADPISVAFSPNGKKAYVTNYDDETLSIINVASGEVTDTITVGGYPISVAFSPKGKKAYVANVGDNTISVIRN